MKKLLINSLAIALFSLFSFSAQAQLGTNSVNDANCLAEGIVYNPSEGIAGVSHNSFASFTKKLFPVVAVTELCSSIQFKYAQILNRDVESLTNTSLFNFIDEWWGTKYRFGGSTKKGIDCSSFSGLLMGTVFGLSLPRTAREQYAKCVKLVKDQLAEGDLVFFNTRGGISHVGVYLGEGNFVHSCSSRGVSVNNLEDNYWKNRFIAGGRPETGDYTAGNL